MFNGTFSPVEQRISNTRFGRDGFRFPVEMETADWRKNYDIRAQSSLETLANASAEMLISA